ncbi:MAG: metallophosphoesterase [Euryarchaeota archaeon]|nr:metallophosphoesterase [Euryarchaeota archaeon]
MDRTRAFSIFVAFFVVLSIVAMHTNSNTVYAYVFFEKTYAPRDIVLSPSPGMPVYTHPGSVISIQLSEKYSPNDVEEIKLLSPPNNPEIVPEIVSYSENSLLIYIPEQDKFSKPLDGVYFLCIKFKDGNEVLIPNAVWISTSEKTKLRIAHISDTHFTISGGGWVHNDLYITYMEGTISALTYAILKGVDMVIVSGDVCDLSSSADAYSFWLDILTYTTLNDLPVYMGKGNHDDPPNVFVRYIAPAVYNISIDKFEIIFLDSGGDRGYPTMNQLEWLENVLSEAGDKYKIIVVHHPPFTAWQWWKPGKQDPPFYGWVNGSWDSDEWTWSNGTHTETRKWTDFLYLSYARYGSNESREFFRIIDNYDVRVILSGHVHTHRLVIWNGKHYFHTETTTSQINAHPEDTLNGLNILEFDAINDSFKMLESSGMDGMSIIKAPYAFSVLLTCTEDTVSYVFINALGENLQGIVRLPAFHITNIMDVETTKDANVQEGTLSVGSYILPFVTLDLNIPSGDTIGIVIHSSDKTDNEKPQLELYYMSPSKPREGKSVTIQVKATDDSSGVYMVYAIYEHNGKEHRVVFKRASGEIGETLFSYTFPEAWLGMHVDIYAVDATGKVSEKLSIDVPVQALSPSSSPSPSPSPTPAAGGLSTGAIVGIVIAVIVIVGVGAYFAMRRR